jgi:hypothetical protein
VFFTPSLYTIALCPFFFATNHHAPDHSPACGGPICAWESHGTCLSDQSMLSVPIRLVLTVLARAHSLFLRELFHERLITNHPPACIIYDLWSNSNGVPF